MPTGYTAPIEEQDGYTFKEYAMSCARAFGDLVMMRDEPMGAEIPDSFQPDTYYADSVKAATIELEKLHAMSAKERIAYGEERRASAIASATDGIASDEQKQLRYAAMKAEVLKWEPPSPDHVGMKEFMLSQINDSTQYIGGYWNGVLTKAKEATPLSFYVFDVKAATRRIETGVVEAAKETDRAAERTTWVRKLRESLVNA